MNNKKDYNNNAKKDVIEKVEYNKNSFVQHNYSYELKNSTYSPEEYYKTLNGTNDYYKTLNGTNDYYKTLNGIAC